MSKQDQPDNNHGSTLDKYTQIMALIRRRLDHVIAVDELEGDEVLKGEMIALQGRKVIEAIAFACLVATENASITVPRDLRGHWNAREIIQRLGKCNITTYPSPSVLRSPTAEETAKNPGIKAVFEGIPDRRIDRIELIQMYQRMNPWLHESNPYTSTSKDILNGRVNELRADLAKLDNFIVSHAMTIKGIGYLCVLRDRVDGQLKVRPITKIAEIVD